MAYTSLQEDLTSLASSTGITAPELIVGNNGAASDEAIDNLVAETGCRASISVYRTLALLLKRRHQATPDSPANWSSRKLHAVLGRYYPDMCMSLDELAVTITEMSLMRLHLCSINGPELLFFEKERQAASRLGGEASPTLLERFDAPTRPAIRQARPAPPRSP